MFSMSVTLFLVTFILNAYVTASDFQEACLKAHNKYRAIHGVPPLKLNKKLSNLTQSWADHLASKGTFYHRPNNKYGENIYSYWNSNPSAVPTAELVVTNWYNEIRHYNYNNPVFSLKTGHFTAVIWKSTKELGMAKAKKKKGNTYVVANYNPQGNTKGKFAENVLPKKSSDRSSSKYNTCIVFGSSNLNLFISCVLICFIK